MRTGQLQFLRIGNRFELAQGIVGTLGALEGRPALNGPQRAVSVVIGRHEHRWEWLILLRRRCIGREIFRYRRLPLAIDGLEGGPTALIRRLEVLEILACGNLPHAIFLHVDILDDGIAPGGRLLVLPQQAPFTPTCVRGVAIGSHGNHRLQLHAQIETTERKSGAVRHAATAVTGQ